MKGWGIGWGKVFGKTADGKLKRVFWQNVWKEKRSKYLERVVEETFRRGTFDFFEEKRL